MKKMSTTWAFVIFAIVVVVLAINKKTAKIGYGLAAILVLIWALRWAQQKGTSGT